MQLEEEFQLICERSVVQSICGRSSRQWSHRGQRGQRLFICSGQKTSELTEGAAELFKVDKAVLVFVYQAEDPQGDAALVGAERPGIQQGQEGAELLETQLVLLQIGLAGVVMEQSGTLHRPVAAEEMLPLGNKTKNNFYLEISSFFMTFIYVGLHSRYSLTLNKL